MSEVSKEEQAKMDSLFSDEEYFQNYKTLCLIEKIVKAIRGIYDCQPKSTAIMASRLFFLYIDALLDEAIIQELNKKKKKAALRKDIFGENSTEKWLQFPNEPDFENNFYIKYLGRAKP